MKIFIVLVALFAVLSTVTASAPIGKKAPKKYNKFYELLMSKVIEIRFEAEQYLTQNGYVKSPSPDYPYWNFIPQYIASVKETSPSASWASKCFKSNTAKYGKSTDGKTLEIEVTSSQPTSLVCSEWYAAMTTSTIDISYEIKTDKSNTVVSTISLPLPEDVTQPELWDISAKGVRLFHYPLDRVTTLSNLLETVALFIPEMTQGVPPQVAQMNIDFMSKYTHFQISPRDPALNVVPDESEIKSGDSFYIMRLDGLNPLLAWAMGSTTGHVTTAIWIDGELYVCESTISDSYWPTDFVQKTPYRTWINQTIAADFQVVYVPLNEQARKSYNETAAVEFFKSVEGLDYGFKTIIWGWIDTATDNFPCLPPDFSSNCLQWEFLEPFIAYIDRRINDIGEMIWNPGFAKRINMPSDTGYRTSELFYEASKQGYSTQDVIQMPEQDIWVYNTTRYDEPAVGKNMVCCVFVCNTWKAAGVFGELTDSVNCGELTNWDDYALTIHADKYRQIVGEYSLELNDFKTKDPYAHMAETCASLAPNYEKSPTC